MKRMKAKVSYDGTDFAGYQSQPNMRTVQSEIDKALVKLHKDPSVHSVASGRTDSGVHALGQVIHFDTPLDLGNRWRMALNVLLPKDVRVVEVEEAAADFHARYSAAGKTYQYRWTYNEVQSPFERNFAVHLGRWDPDIERMQEAAQYLIGTHDFTSFCSAKTATSNKVRTIRKLTLKRQGDHLLMEVEGDGFLYNMVRTIAGVLLAVGIGWDEPEDVKRILDTKDRKSAGKTAPAHGLYLLEVTY
ncbi:MULTISPECIES: tRNA pseudouridine(38-40) synthase TruA [unclassified Sporosarcina]|uniref:tRNA pseudouridine(38-40) synthase TruA n=1 Tax=unclassified Sporosarcina TaxID=2647733 RepID=UPI00203ED74B|nr:MULTISPECIES: tRNA pseudouridine(38-40) synthase TruA [unclassified Sporosarcina]GKV66302.1 tRNA pseudouridine synthase A [Sporosarcina sp. NCCP-2331]GLB56419.1 tRNA pseudouridine synthase A [Sporosarcina sp. NCCP-2378]